MTFTLYNEDCLETFKRMSDNSIDAILSDPPYAEVDRDYGRLTEEAWMSLMQNVVIESKRVLKPSGSAMFIIQPNSKHVGEMRLWVWKFMLWAGEYWNIVQDVYWWNIAAVPTVHSQRAIGLMRPSVKYLVWLGNPDCYRNQDNILWSETERNIAHRTEKRFGRVYMPGGQSVNPIVMANTALERGGVTPYNLLPMANSNSRSSAGAYGHGAGTPYKLCDWMVRYLVPTNGVVYDPFSGTATMGIAALNHGHTYIGSEKMEKYHMIAIERLNQVGI